MRQFDLVRVVRLSAPQYRDGWKLNSRAPRVGDVGTLVDVGMGKIHAGDMREIVMAKDRNAAGAVAPPQGLCLWEVGYPAPGEPVTPRPSSFPRD